MIRLQTLNETGELCPKCGNESVFKTLKKAWVNVFKYHKYFEYRCFMKDCDYKKIVQINDKKNTHAEKDLLQN